MARFRGITLTYGATAGFNIPSSWSVVDPALHSVTGSFGAYDTGFGGSYNSAGVYTSFGGDGEIRLERGFFGPTRALRLSRLAASKSFDATANGLTARDGPWRKPWSAKN